MSAEVTEDEISEKCLKPNIPSDSDIAEDEDIMAYLTGMISELEGPYDLETVQESVGPFLESYGCEDDVNSRICESIVDLYNSKNGGGDGNDNDDAENVINTEQTQLLQSGVSMISDLNIKTDAELDAQSFLWGTDQGVKANHNVVREAYDNKDSAKERRVARKELERSRREYEAAAKRAEEESDRAGVVTTMVLPDYESTTERSRDIQVRNISLALDNGRSILDSGELRLAYGRRYGLVGKNGVGKTTLLKAIAWGITFGVW
eukprot:CAMPEP_0194397336 /NCGR_PEP_ID=MMETSP0174-20130528/125488_1 /TAXON_ID=216777 /ORGANISM="Proboscia alata, Strain PI-D3" /LENGTH=262 /DNA_ID=CAMNT_0039193503 /DNA_START=97 /DNA_END=885 /DNA_ORIENTATION=+